MRRVAITGLGVVSALGVGTASFWREILNGKSGIGRITRFDPSGLRIQIAAEVPAFQPPAVSVSQLDLLDMFSQYALVAALEATEHAQLVNGSFNVNRVGVSIGTAFGGISTWEDGFKRTREEGRQRVHPYLIPRMMHNAAASQVSMFLKLRGPTVAFSTACAASAHAIGEAAEMIRTGRADVMLAGGADAPITMGVMQCWESLRVLASAPLDDPASACRPFSRDRQGLVLGEGAGIIVLEEWEHARARGAKVLAELAGYSSTSDAGHITQPGTESACRAMTAAFAQADVAPSQVDYVNAHGTGTHANDRTETEIIKRTFGTHASRVAVSSTKSMHGHAMGASAALELIASVLAIQHNIVPPTANYREADPECDLDYVPNRPQERRVDVAVSNSFAFGGLNAVLVVRRLAT